eukprot:1877971-Prymnesium_polylepis.1
MGAVVSSLRGRNFHHTPPSWWKFQRLHAGFTHGRIGPGHIQSFVACGVYSPRGAQPTPPDPLLGAPPLHARRASK